MTKLKNSICAQSQKLKMWQNSTTLSLIKLKNLNMTQFKPLKCDQTKKYKYDTQKNVIKLKILQNSQSQKWQT